MSSSFLKKVEKLETEILQLEIENHELKQKMKCYDFDNYKLQEIQRLAKAGTWELNNLTYSFSISDELSKLICDDPAEIRDITWHAFLKAIIVSENMDIKILLDENVIQNGISLDFEHELIRPDGKRLHVHHLCKTFYNSIGQPLVTIGLIQNITLEHNQELELKHFAHFDALTNLPNRVLLSDRLNHLMMQCQLRKQFLAIAYLDLDGFKTINDLHGHHVGDQLLIAVAQCMKKSLRRGDTLARIGGDEFIVVMVGIEKIEDCEPALERLLEAAAEPVIVDGIQMQVSASIGVTLYPKDGVDADELIRHADQAMYVAKQMGKNRYQLFDTTENNAIKCRQESVNDIVSALERREFVLHYQPKVNMFTGEVIGVEALIRWQHPDLGLVPPLDFLPAIEGQKISLELGEWVISTALNQISQWQSIGIKLLISVNISAHQLQQADFVTRLTVLLAAHPDLSTNVLELEILETSALSNIDEISSTMQVCRDLGVNFSLDDFGTGYSSLTYLRRLPADVIKIDQSFVRDMLNDVDDLAIVEGVIGLAKAFQREVIAEGVETVEHGTALLQLGCELAQGYGIARPMPAEDIPEWISNWKPDDAWQSQHDCQPISKPNSLGWQMK